MCCPNCKSESVVKNGFNSTSKQMYSCNTCGRQFVLNSEKYPISDEKKELIDRLLLERISLEGIVRVAGVSESWLQKYVNEKYDQTPREIKVEKKLKGRLTIECDELWSFVGKKSNKQ
ncbi:hypothetical protein CCP3SC5AM1_1220004 [Gammaproteobacteria bacterium]